MHVITGNATNQPRGSGLHTKATAIHTERAVLTRMTYTYYLIYYPSPSGGFQAGYSNNEMTAKKAYELCHVLGARTWNVQKGCTNNDTKYGRSKASDGGAIYSAGGWVTSGVLKALQQYEAKYGAIEISTIDLGIPD